MNKISIEVIVKIQSLDRPEDVFSANKTYNRKEIESNFIHEQILGFTRTIKTMIDDKFNPKPNKPESTGETVALNELTPDIPKATPFISRGGEISHKAPLKSSSKNPGPVYYRGNTNRQ